MRGFVLSLIIVLGMVSCSFAGECSNGQCNLVPRRVVSVTRSVVRETVRLPKRAVNSCTNGVCRSRSVTVVR